jgi:hypothetical protein
MPLPRPVVLLLPVLLLQPVQAVEYPLREQPLEVRVEQLDGRNEQVVVDWGRVSESLRRDPAECDQQRETFKSFLTSPEFMAFVEKHGMRTDLLAAMASKEELEKLRRHLASQPHATALPRAIQQRSNQAPVPGFLRDMGAEQRRNLRLVLYDDADSHQREWLLRWHAAHADDPYLTIVVAQGWSSFGAIERFAESHPEITISPIASDDYAAGFGVTALPAVITFPDDDHIHRIEGLIPVEEGTSNE